MNKLVNKLVNWKTKQLKINLRMHKIKLEIS